MTIHKKFTRDLQTQALFIMLNHNNVPNNKEQPIMSCAFFHLVSRLTIAPFFLPFHLTIIISIYKIKLNSTAFQHKNSFC